MSPESPSRRRRGTPISDGLGADLHSLGTILANHTRGLDDFLQRQGQHLDQRRQTLLSETSAVLLPPDLNLDGMSMVDLQNICRSKRLRGWSKLRRDALLAFLKEHLGSDLEAVRLLETEAAAPSSSKQQEEMGLPSHVDATRVERLLVLLLSHLGVSPEQIHATWQDPP